MLYFCSMTEHVSFVTTTWYWQQLDMVPDGVGAGAEVWQETAEEEAIAEVDEGGKSCDEMLLLGVLG